MVIVSYPKSGRTWLRVLLCRYISQKYDIVNDLDLFNMTSKVKTLLKSDFQHEQGNHRLYLTAEDLAFNHHYYSNKHVVFLSRDARDTAVSMYHQLQTRETIDDSGFYKGTFSDLYRDQRFGLEKILAFNHMWLTNISSIENHLCISYEDMLKNTTNIVEQVLLLMGEKDIDKNILNETVEYSRFENMKKLEKSGSIKHYSMKPSGDGDNAATKVRRGGTGGYKDYLTSDDEKYTEEMMNKYKVS